MNGKVHICDKHFEASDIQQSSCKSWMKYGALPTQNLPAKSIESIPTQPRRIIKKHEISKKNVDCSYTLCSTVSKHKVELLV